MQLLDHVSISVAALDSARPFYDAVMAPLGAAKVYDHVDALGFHIFIHGVNGHGRGCVDGFCKDGQRFHANSLLHIDSNVTYVSFWGIL